MEAGYADGDPFAGGRCTAQVTPCPANPPPTFATEASTGKTLGLDDFLGKVPVALTFVGTLPSISAEAVIDAYNDVFAEFGRRRVQLLIVTPEDAEAVRARRQRRHHRSAPRRRRRAAARALRQFGDVPGDGRHRRSGHGEPRARRRDTARSRRRRARAQRRRTGGSRRLPRAERSTPVSEHGSTEDGITRFEDVKQRLEDRGESEELASEIAARDVAAARPRGQIRMSTKPPRTSARRRSRTSIADTAATPWNPAHLHHSRSCCSHATNSLRAVPRSTTGSPAAPAAATLDDLVLACGEAVDNSVEHGTPPVTVDVSWQ